MTKLGKMETIVLFCAFIAVGGIFFGFGKYYQQWDSKIIEDKLKKPYNCPKSGSSTKDEFLNMYIVKKGDTLLSISKNELGDPSRVNEIINLNSDRYQLSIKDNFIEVGWKLYLPTKDMLPSSGKLGQYSGAVKEVNGGTLTIESPKGVGDFDLDNYNGNAKYSSLKTGDCVTLILDGKTVPARIKRIDFQ